MGPDTPEHWRFYGRADALATLARQLPPSRMFAARSIQGRRGIGKTELLAEAARRAGGNPPVLIFTLRAADDEDPHVRVGRLIKEAKAYLPPCEGTPWPPPHLATSNTPPRDRFVDLVNDLLHRGVVVGLDEFHLARPLGLTSIFKAMIDAAGSVSGTHPPGWLYVMGSHQQQLMDLFRSDQPLYQRIRLGIHLDPWRVPTVLEMAHEQGFLAYPHRFLTLWTAFGGIPRPWEDFLRDEDDTRLPDMARWSSDQVWRTAFLRHQDMLLHGSSEERFDDRATIELNPACRTLLRHLGSRAPRGDVYHNVLHALTPMDKATFDDSLDVLVRHLHILEVRTAFDTDGAPRLQIADVPTLFQLHVFPELASGFERVKRAHTVGTAGRQQVRLETLEGLALERLAEGALAAARPDDFIARNAWTRTGGHEVDLLVLEGGGTHPGARVTIVSCKRNPDKHRGIDAGHAAFLATARAARTDLALPEEPHETVLVSPVFAPAARSRTRRQTLDIRDLARLCGVAIPPPPAPPPSQAPAALDPRPAASDPSGP